MTLRLEIMPHGNHAICQWNNIEALGVSRKKALTARVETLRWRARHPDGRHLDV